MGMILHHLHPHDGMVRYGEFVSLPLGVGCNWFDPKYDTFADANYLVGI